MYTTHILFVVRCPEEENPETESRFLVVKTGGEKGEGSRGLRFLLLGEHSLELDDAIDLQLCAKSGWAYTLEGGMV